MRTTVPDVVAAGDCAAFVSPYADSDDPIRLESVQNATDQGRVAGATIANGDVRYDAAPWFWSDQYDMKLQLAGVHHSAAREVIRGDQTGKKFSIVHLDRADRVVAVDSVNMPADHVAARRLVAQRARVDERVVRDSSTPLKSAVTTAPNPMTVTVAGRTATTTRQD
jgi:3-phenylpropionate/trans-cinnamate dioxygenase ferredoxin reductase subunit